MARAASSDPEGPLLFVAREPDETLRTYLPVLAELRRRGEGCEVLFHHRPSDWARQRLAELGLPLREVALPRAVPLPTRVGRAAAEIAQLVAVRALARRLLDELEPRAVVVIQDTLLLERFLVREANARGIGSLVVQWAFTYPQATYDLLNEFQRGRLTPEAYRAALAAGRVPTRQSETAPAETRVLGRAIRALRRRLGLEFDLVNSYGGGEARVFAVMGEAFREQFLAQGVRKERIEVVGHPLHDAAFAQRAAISPERVREIKRRYGIQEAARIVLYATQPVLWRGVVSREELSGNVRALGDAVAALGPDYLLLLKLHPRESREDYSAVEGQGRIQIVTEAEVAELIAACELFVSSSSSTVILAMMLDRPIVTVNFNQVPHFDYYAKVGGTLHARSVEQAAASLRLAAEDEPTRLRLAEERARVLARYARFDGRATQRLADLVQELAGSAVTASLPTTVAQSAQIG
jgi:hypothetical protein